MFSTLRTKLLLGLTPVLALMEDEHNRARRAAALPSA